MNDTTELRGTFACPICGQDTPHHHPPEVAEAYRSDQVRRDGWISTLVRLPNDMTGKFYLCRGHKIVPPPEEDNEWRFREIHGMLWQRAMGHLMAAEVLQWDQSAQSFLLAQWTGSGTISGKDTRAPVYVTPTHWRELPPFDQPNDAEWMTGRIAGLEAVVKDQRERLRSLQINTDYERERLIRELGEARGTAGVDVPVELDVAGVPKLELTLLEQKAIATLNTIKAWRDSDGNEPFPDDAREGMELVLMLAAARRKGVR